MGISIDKYEAARRLRLAHDMAIDDSLELPQSWLDATDFIGQSPSRTMVAALGTALLAKATDGNVDALSLKMNYSDRTFSLRSVCHNILVPASRELKPRFHLGATGNEPINNQPFFRYDHMDEIDRINETSRPFMARLRDELRRANSIDKEEALLALAAFLRQRILVQQEADKLEGGIHSELVVDLSQLFSSLEDFLMPDAPERPGRLQAVVAGLVWASTRVEPSLQRINDPSRQIPGDIHLPIDAPTMSIEVRGKPVAQHEAEQFVILCSRAGIGIAWIVVSHHQHRALDRRKLFQVALEKGILALVIESIPELFTLTLGAVNTIEGADIIRIANAIDRALAVATTGVFSRQVWARLMARGA